MFFQRWIASIHRLNLLVVCSRVLTLQSGEGVPHSRFGKYYTALNDAHTLDPNYLKAMTEWVSKVCFIGIIRAVRVLRVRSILSIFQR